MNIDEYLERYIKDLLRSFPAIEGILLEYGIGCATCAVGTCRLRDIIEIHNLSPGEEASLLARIGAVLFPGEEVVIPPVRRAARPKGSSYSPPLKRLVEEHKLIKRLIALIPAIVLELEENPEGGWPIAHSGIGFIREYADRFHHAKEEQILFSYFDPNLDILKSMIQEHELARAHVRAMLAALEAKDLPAIIRHLGEYGELLTEHIRKEDEVLYPWLDRNLSVSQVGEMFSRFDAVEQEFTAKPAGFAELIAGMEKACGTSKVPTASK